MRCRLCDQIRGGLRTAVRSKFPALYISRKWTSTSARNWSTPLARRLGEAITATGPIPLATYMRMCLTGDINGYYTSIDEGRDQFGAKGDFVTSPEISQIFGELVGIWFVAEWMAQGRRKGVEMVEIGPGRGTLMDDVLRTVSRFQNMALSIDAVYLVETSAALRDAQKKLLCGDAPITETEAGFQSISKYSQLPIIWTENIRLVPENPTSTPLIVAHEFFDALPIHAFQAVSTPFPLQEDIQTPTDEHQLHDSRAKAQESEKNTWRELVITPAPPDSTHNSLRTPKILESSDGPPDFELSVSKSPTHHSRFLPRISPRYEAIRSTLGAVIEISPESHSHAQELARRIGGSSKMPKTTPSGAALIIDYGPLDTIPTNSLRGIRQHQRVSPFSRPGEVDISADVDFIGLAEAALGASQHVQVHGPIEQGSFLQSMGIKERAERLMQAFVANGEKVKVVDSSWRRLVDRGQNGMGKVYKAMAVVPVGRSQPVGFGGDVEY